MLAGAVVGGGGAVAIYVDVGGDYEVAVVADGIGAAAVVVVVLPDAVVELFANTPRHSIKVWSPSGKIKLEREPDRDSEREREREKFNKHTWNVQRVSKSYQNDVSSDNN